MTRRNVVILVVILTALTVWYLKPPSDSTPSPTPTPSPAPVSVCSSDALRGVYHPYRLKVLGKCQTYVGTVTSVRAEEDGDHHVDVAPDPGYERYLNQGDYDDQHGSLVTEIMPGQHLPIPDIGQHVIVTGTWVYDANHGWNEIHPIWCINGRCSLPVVPPIYD